MGWWALILTLFGLWILSMAANQTLGGMVHGFLLCGIAVTLIRTWQGSQATMVNPPRRAKRPASTADRHRAADA